ncbi:MAG: pyridoxamine 5'-phosphate oxidase family protein [Planctomycetota bacterium]
MTAPLDRPFPSQKPVPTGDLAAILDDLWARLEEGAARAKPAFHLPTLCTVRPTEGEGGNEPSARVVVLRYAERIAGPHGAGTVGCHTDVRSPKAADVRANPRAAWVFYDHEARLQVRLTGATRLLTAGPEFDAAWEATTPSARRCYLAPYVPGTPTERPEPNMPATVRQRDPTADESAPGRANFALLRTDADRIEWLFLRHDGHQRALFTQDDGAWRGTWVAV